MTRTGLLDVLLDVVLHRQRDYEVHMHRDGDALCISFIHDELDEELRFYLRREKSWTVQAYQRIALTPGGDVPLTLLITRFHLKSVVDAFAGRHA